MLHAFLLTATAAVLAGSPGKTLEDLMEPGATVEKLAGDFQFTEGPAVDADGNVFFTDQPNDRILKYGVDGKLSTFLQPWRPLQRA